MDYPHYHAIALGQAVSETLCDIVDTIVHTYEYDEAEYAVFNAMDDEDAVFHALWAGTLDDDDLIITCRRVLEF